ncbi:MAG: hypothetical protein P1V36_04910 [Planctomycetota bacterium]|nr:hypothetical protein [Planctomycetota bacterium]
MSLAFLISVTVWFGGADGDPQVAVQEVFRDYDYQRSMIPEPKEGAAPERWSREAWHEQMERNDPRYRRLPDDRAARERRRREQQRRTSSGGGGGGLASLLELIVYVAIGVALLTVLVSVVRGWGGREATIKPRVQPGTQVPAAALDAPRSEAERLAAEGRYDEAVHILLLKTIEALVATQPGGVPAAWTSREIQGGAPMPAAARTPFGALVDTVEHSLFGGLLVDRRAWEACLARFHEFERVYRTARP